MREAGALLVNTLTIVGGRPLEPLPPQPPAPWARDPIWPALQKEFSDRLQAMRDRGHTPAALRAAAEAELELELLNEAARGDRPAADDARRPRRRSRRSRG